MASLNERAPAAFDQYNEKVMSGGDAESLESYESQEGEWDLDERTWLRIKQNDPEITWLFVHFYHTGFVYSVDWENEGQYINANNAVKKIVLCDIDMYTVLGERRANINDFFKSLARNRSIESLVVHRWRFMRDESGCLALLWPLLEDICNLRHFRFSDCTMGSILESTLSKTNRSSLERLEFIENDIYDDAGGKFIAELGHQNLLWLSLQSNFYIEKNGCVALAELLQHPECKLRRLELCNEKINDEWLILLADSLAKNTTLRIFYLAVCRGVTPRGWHVFLRCLQSPNLKLRELYFAGNTIDDEGAALLGNALGSTTSSLKMLDLCGDEKSITALGWQAFGACLQSPTSTLESLLLSDNCIDDEGMVALGHVLAVNRNLKKLDLSFNRFVKTNGWRALSFVLHSPNSGIEMLKLNDNHIDDEGMTALGNALMANRTLKSLDISGNRPIGSAGWCAFLSFLGSSVSVLEELQLHSNNIDGEGMVALANGLASNSVVKVLNLSNTSHLSSIGWRNFFDVLQNPASVLERLYLDGNNVGDESTSTLVNSLSNIASLKHLDLSFNPSISEQGWRTISTLLQSHNCMLTELVLHHNNINDEVLLALANALVDNKSLRALRIGNDNQISTRGWAALSDVICDQSSMDATYSSNHTLRKLDSDMSVFLASLLRLKRNNTKTEAARQKILEYHCLKDGVGVEAFVGMEVKVLPVGIAWIVRDYTGFPVLYRLFRSMPILFDTNEKAKAAVKRKRG